MEQISNQIWVTKSYKNIFRSGILFLALLFSFQILAQDEPQPATEEGEDLDLSGVAALFKESETLEEFEEKLNSEEAEVNNLDLNKDGEIDYLRVLESVEGTTHLIVIQAALGEEAYQDVCTIEVDKSEDGNTYVQIVGDKSIYGDSYILEPPPEEQEKFATDAWIRNRVCQLPARNSTKRPIQTIQASHFTLTGRMKNSIS